MSQENEQKNEQKYEIKDGFFILNDGVKLPAVGIYYLYNRIYDNMLDISLLYSLEKGDFINGVVIKLSGDGAEFNNKLEYRLKIKNYVEFKLGSYHNNNMFSIGACLTEMYVENIDKLVENEYEIQSKDIECVDSFIYRKQLNLTNFGDDIDNYIVQRLIGFLQAYLQLSENKDSSFNDNFEIPHVFHATEYKWKEIKQAILLLRKPLDHLA